MADTHKSSYIYIYVVYVCRFFLSYRILIISIQNIWSLDGILAGATAPGQSRTGSHGNKGVFCTVQIWTHAIKFGLTLYPSHRVLFLLEVRDLTHLQVKIPYSHGIIRIFSLSLSRLSLATCRHTNTHIYI